MARHKAGPHTQLYLITMTRAVSYFGRRREVIGSAQANSETTTLYKARVSPDCCWSGAERSDFHSAMMFEAANSESSLAPTPYSSEVVVYDTDRFAVFAFTCPGEGYHMFE